MAPREAGHQDQSTWQKHFSRSGKQRQTEATEKRWKENEKYSWSVKTPRQKRQKKGTLARLPTDSRQMRQGEEAKISNYFISQWVGTKDMSETHLLIISHGKPGYLRATTLFLLDYTQETLARLTGYTDPVAYEYERMKIAE